MPLGLVALAIGAGALWLSDRAGMGVTDDHSPAIQEVQQAEPAPDHSTHGG